MKSLGVILAFILALFASPSSEQCTGIEMIDSVLSGLLGSPLLDVIVSINESLALTDGCLQCSEGTNLVSALLNCAQLALNVTTDPLTLELSVVMCVIGECNGLPMLDPIACDGTTKDTTTPGTNNGNGGDDSGSGSDEKDSGSGSDEKHGNKHGQGHGNGHGDGQEPGNGHKGGQGPGNSDGSGQNSDNVDNSSGNGGGNNGDENSGGSDNDGNGDNSSGNGGGNNGNGNGNNGGSNNDSGSNENRSNRGGNNRNKRRRGGRDSDEEDGNDKRRKKRSNNPFLSIDANLSSLICLSSNITLAQILTMVLQSILSSLEIGISV